MVDRRPKWQRLADRLRADIAGGRYAVGDLIPSVRELMEGAVAELGAVSDNTATHAIEVLRDEGLVAGEVGVGTRVVGVPDMPAVPAPELVEELRAEVVKLTERVTEMEKLGDEVFFLKERLERLERGE